MATATSDKRPWHLWVVGVVSLLWNAIGASDYVLTETHNAMAMKGLSPEELAYVLNFPAWTVACWALAVWGGVAGSILLLARSRWAVQACAVSFLGAAGTTLYEWTADAPASFRTTGQIGFAAAIWAGTVLLLWYAWTMRKRGVLR